MFKWSVNIKLKCNLIWIVLINFPEKLKTRHCIATPSVILILNLTGLFVTGFVVVDNHQTSPRLMLRLTDNWWWHNNVFKDDLTRNTSWFNIKPRPSWRDLFTTQIQLCFGWVKYFSMFPLTPSYSLDLTASISIFVVWKV